ncbi:DUF4145 domain-containing protein [Pseudomonas kielensis]|uniref:DUF4145 domain-containing protein n=1 Tax=Pseudomonas kielensis TaxID=2762577 RepID=UPI0015F8BD01|nr:DUF4145 domain-containing protein [Pseudomonas kielensis]WKL53113.1 DUF4145 domain-containing protein [Pseudomonas kielensis]
MNKEILSGAFVKEKIFEYRCPHCHSGLLRLDGDFRSEETQASQTEHQEDGWEPEMIRLMFNLTLKCTTCQELVFVVGNGFVEEEVGVDDTGEWYRDYVEYFTPTFFHPALQLIDYPARAPSEVTSPLNVAGALFFSSPASCCNNVRIAAEQILSQLGIPEKDGDSFISFGNRIKQLPEDQKSIKELFSALRWLGNHGSHPGNEIEVDDALHALEITEFLLEEVYGERREALAKLAEAINDRKGPLGRLHKVILKQY